jgi:hypothetical protein
MIMDILSISLILLVLTLLLAMLKALLTAKKVTVQHSYAAAGALLSPAELSFFKVLELVVKDNAHIVAKVRVADLLSPRKGRQDLITGQRFELRTLEGSA